MSARREGKWMNYRIVNSENEFAAELIKKTLDWLESKAEMRQEYEKLRTVCCAAEVSATIFRAPIPKVFAQTHLNNNSRVELDTFLL